MSDNLFPIEPRPTKSTFTSYVGSIILAGVLNGLHAAVVATFVTAAVALVLLVLL